MWFIIFFDNVYPKQCTVGIWICNPLICNKKFYHWIQDEEVVPWNAREEVRWSWADHEPRATIIHYSWINVYYKVKALPKSSEATWPGGVHPAAWVHSLSPEEEAGWQCGRAGRADRLLMAVVPKLGCAHPWWCADWPPGSHEIIFIMAGGKHCLSIIMYYFYVFNWGKLHMQKFYWEIQFHITSCKLLII